MSSFLKRVINKIENFRRFDFWNISRLFAPTISIVIFLTAIDYFTKSPSFQITRPPNSYENYNYHVEKISDFYVENDLPIPQYVRLFKDKKVDYLENGYSPHEWSNIFVIKEVIPNANLNNKLNALKGGLVLNIIELEKQLSVFHYEKFVFTSGSVRVVKDYHIKKITDYIKTKVDTIEYYILLNAVLRSRVFTNQIWFENDGELDLENLKINIFSPKSIVSGSRNENILSFVQMGKIVSQVKTNSDGLIIDIPNLKKDESYAIEIKTVENYIDSTEIFYSFKEARIIEKDKVLRIFTITFISMIILSLFFRGKKD